MKVILFRRHDGFNCMMRPVESARRSDESDEQFTHRTAQEDLPVVLLDEPRAIRLALGAALKEKDPVPEYCPRKWAVHFGLAHSMPEYVIVDDADAPIERDALESWKAGHCVKLKPASHNKEMR